MDGRIDAFTLIFLVLAVIIVLKLRSVLGQRSSEDDARQERYKEQARAAAEAQEKVVAMPRRERQAPEPQADAAETATTQTATAERKVRDFAGGNAAMENGLLSILAADRKFDPEVFMNGAKQAYEMIVTGFAEGNRQLLRNLLSREVYDGFAAAITEREARGEQIDQSFVGINKSEIVEAGLKKGVAQISVRFVSELISATRDKAGTVLAGDPKKIKEVIDIWTFTRDVTSRDPNWKLVATQAPA